MDSLRRKLAFSYGLLILIILGVSAWGIYHFIRLGRAVDVILINNYKSIVAAENMKESLERQDSAAQFFIAGYSERARQEFKNNLERFLGDFSLAASNITEPGESEIINDINARFSIYHQQLERFLNTLADSDKAGLSKIYFGEFEPQFSSIKQRLDDLLHLNQRAMVAASDRATAESWRAVVSTGVVAVLALTVALLFAWRFTKYMVDPITELSEKAKRIAEGDFDQHIDISSRDEIGVLAEEFNRMAARLRDLRKSDRWRMMIEQKKADAVIDSFREPVIVTDSLGRVSKINDSAARLLGISPEEANTNNNESQEPQTERSQILQAVQHAISMQRPVAGEAGPAVVPIMVGDAQRSFRLNTTPIRDGDGRLIGAVTRLEESTSGIGVDRLKDEFISVAASKLRNPLQSLRMALHAITEGYTGDLTEKQVEMIQSARTDAEQLDDLTNDLVELAELQSGNYVLAIERQRPSDFARAAIDRHRSAAAAKRIKLTSKVMADFPYVMGDKQAIKRVLDNLLTNAIRHTGRDGEVTIDGWERHNQIFICVRDTGEGIPPRYLPDIFSRFIRAEGRTGGGTGLGLALTKRLLEAQGGQVSVESRVNEGTSFTFTLPIAGQAVTGSLSEGRGD